MHFADGSRVLLALLLGLTAAGANVIGGSLIAHRQWSHNFLKYFIALGAGFMLATALLEMIPESLKLRAESSSAGALVNNTDTVFFLFLPGIFWFTFSSIRLRRIFILGRRRITRKFHTRMRAMRRCWGL